MLGGPPVGNKYRQEYYKGEAEDKGEVLSLTESVTVTYGTFDNCLKTKDTNPLENEVEHKYYSATVGGVVKEVEVKDGDEVVELIDITP